MLKIKLFDTKYSTFTYSIFKGKMLYDCDRRNCFMKEFKKNLNKYYKSLENLGLKR